MAVKKSELSRREFLKKLGIAGSMALPILDSPLAMGQTTTAPTRVLLVALQHGWGPENGSSSGGRWTDTFTGTETNFTLPKCLQVFNSIKNQCVFIDGLRTNFWGNAHDVSYSDIFTAAVRSDEPSNNALGGPFMYPRGPSLDWLIGNTLNKNVLRLSHGYQSWGAAFHPLCFAQSGTNYINQSFYTSAYQAYMGFIDPLKRMQTPTNPAGALSNASNTALITMLGKDGDKLLKALSGSERSKMESYMAALNTLSGQIITSSTGAPSVPLPNQPGVTLPFNDQMDQYLEMIKIAFTLDTHRVCVLGLGEGVNNWSWRDTNNAARVGNTFGNDFHHEIAHYVEAGSAVTSNARAAYEGWVNWYGQKIVNLVNTLNTTRDVDGRTLLDNTVIVLTGEVGNGQHERADQSYIVIGGGGNKIRRGRLIKTPKVNPNNLGGAVIGSRRRDGSIDNTYATYTPYYSRHHVADLWVSIARLAGLNINSFGIDLYNYQPIQLG